MTADAHKNKVQVHLHRAVTAAGSGRWDTVVEETTKAREVAIEARERAKKEGGK